MLRAKLKGSGGEREVVEFLQPIVQKIFEECSLPIPLIERNLQQFARGGYDIIGVDWCAIEVKRCETLQIEQWWRQAVAQAGSREPLLFYRQNHRGWRVCALGRFGKWRKGYIEPEEQVYTGRLDVSWEEFKPWFTLMTLWWAQTLPPDWIPAREAECKTRKEAAQIQKKPSNRRLEFKQKLDRGLIPSPPAGTIPPPWL